MTTKQKNSFLVFAFFGAIILSALGVWQVQRLAWKTDLIDKIESRINSPPIYLSELSEKDGDLSFYPVTVKGDFLFEHQKRLVPRILDGESGAHQIVPMMTKEEILIVNRGWVENNFESIEQKNPQTVQGYLKPFSKKNWFTLENDQDSREVYHLDKKEWSQIEGVEDKGVFPYVLYQTAPHEVDGPIVHVASFVVRNNHKSYAVFWFTMAAVLLGFGLWIRFKK